ncbi:MAG: hypothetical protein JSV91_01860 [Phycisphaerales bacterium]|nr:MAG: hypothetical protein JSV91_01860 [Phycisphaerales bacterium]
MFLLLWLILIVLWLVAGAVNIYTLNPQDTLPPPESIPYADYLPGGEQSHIVTLDLKAEDLPPYDTNVRVSGWGAEPLPADRPGQKDRLVVRLRRKVVFGGWPGTVFGYHYCRTFDVSDPNRPFVETGDAPGPLEVHWSYGQVALLRKFRGQSPFRSVTILWDEVLWRLLVLEIAAALLVFAVWAIDRRIMRSRRRRGACLVCGHLLGPSPKPVACPECGRAVATLQSAESVGLMRRWSARPGRLFLVLFVLLLPLPIISASCEYQSVQHNVTYQPEPTEEWLDGVVELFEYMQQIGRTRVERRFTVDYRCYGRPFLVLDTQTDRFYEMTADLFRPALVQHPRRDSPLDLWPPGLLSWSTVSSDPPVIRYNTVRSGPALALLWANQAAAFVLLCAFRIAVRLRRRIDAPQSAEIERLEPRCSGIDI